jgi:hypothetical protein
MVAVTWAMAADSLTARNPYRIITDATTGEARRLLVLTSAASRRRELVIESMNTEAGSTPYCAAMELLKAVWKISSCATSLVTPFKVALALMVVNVVVLMAAKVSALCSAGLLSGWSSV